MNNISVLIKPSSEKCNMDCKYCFYHDISSKRDVKDYGFMSTDTMKQVINRTFETNANHIAFGFQGGEPTLVGLEFFKKFVRYVNEIKTNQIISYALQTNGTTMTEDFVLFFKENNFLIGLSLDGPKKLNDKNRYYNNKSGTFDDILAASKLFDKYKVAYNILSVVTKHSVNHEKEIYEFFKENNFRYIQFIECLDPYEEKKGTQTWSMSPEDYLTFLNNLFLLWYEDFISGNYIDIRYFSNVISMMLNEQPESCDRRGICSIQNIVEANGHVYPCDFYVFEKMSIGNVFDNSFEDMITSELSKDFIKRSMILHPDCKSCKYLKLCRGGCYRNRSNNNGVMKNYYCHSYYNFFDTNLKKLEEVALLVQQKRIQNR